jgi:hypothetical protein
MAARAARLSIFVTPMRHAFWCAVMVFMQVFILWSLNFIAVEIEDPFGGDANDLDARSTQEDFNQQLLMLVSVEFGRVPTLSLPERDSSKKVYHRKSLTNIWHEHECREAGIPKEIHDTHERDSQATLQVGKKMALPSAASIPVALVSIPVSVATPSSADKDEATLDSIQPFRGISDHTDIKIPGATGADAKLQKETSQLRCVDLETGVDPNHASNGIEAAWVSQPPGVVSEEIVPKASSSGDESNAFMSIIPSSLPRSDNLTPSGQAAKLPDA